MAADQDRGDLRRVSPSVERNREAIRDAFGRMVGRQGRVLEIASGTGEHAVHVTAAFPRLTWQPSDPDPDARASIAAWAADAGERIAAPLPLDVMRPGWSEELGQFDALVCINMVHIAPWAAAEGLFDGAAKCLRMGGRLFLYGPFRREGRHTAPSNTAFDQSLRDRNPTWGVRDLEGEIIPLARQSGLVFADRLAMPANNLSVVFEKRG